MRNLFKFLIFLWPVVVLAQPPVVRNIWDTNANPNVASSSNVVFCSSLAGDDSNVQMGNPNRQAKTLQAAMNLAQLLCPTNAVIWCNPGDTYYFSQAAGTIGLWVTNPLTIYGNGSRIVQTTPAQSIVVSNVASFNCYSLSVTSPPASPVTATLLPVQFLRATNIDIEDMEVDGFSDGIFITCPQSASNNIVVKRVRTIAGWDTFLIGNINSLTSINIDGCYGLMNWSANFNNVNFVVGSTALKIGAGSGGANGATIVVQNSTFQAFGNVATTGVSTTPINTHAIDLEGVSGVVIKNCIAFATNTATGNGSIGGTGQTNYFAIGSQGPSGGSNSSLTIYGNPCPYPAIQLNATNDLTTSCTITPTWISAPMIAVDIYTNFGTFTWTNRPGATMVWVRAIGGGGGGGSGRASLIGASDAGGGGGGGGGTSEAFIPAPALPSTVTVTVGGGGPGGLGVSGTANGNVGAPGTNTAFGSFVAAAGGGGGSLGASAGGAASTGGIGTFLGPGTAATTLFGGVNGNPTVSGQVQGAITTTFCSTGSGGTGGPVTSGAAASTGGQGGFLTATFGSASGGSGGAINSATGGGVGPSVASALCQPGGGGGGSGSWVNSGTTAAGGAGGTFGGGGGGSGSIDNAGTAVTGPGGAGAQGCVMVITYF